MPLLAVLVKALFGNLSAWLTLLYSTRLSLQFTAVLIFAAAYIACVAAYTDFIFPVIAALFSTQWGQFLGLAFPPMAGSVLAGVVSLWGCIVAKRYYEKFSMYLLK